MTNGRRKQVHKGIEEEEKKNTEIEEKRKNTEAREQQ